MLNVLQGILVVLLHLQTVSVDVSVASLSFSSSTFKAVYIYLELTSPTI